ncbi:hypothetical protein ACJIZ3_020063 [Penstemon smallii]|uniref:Uncharacterized protein n=1 Tax=Penstemon smallii TaxID=265156 RepID=A0ABD3SHI3_9LAMI
MENDGVNSMPKVAVVVFVLKGKKGNNKVLSPADRRCSLVGRDNFALLVGHLKFGQTIYLTVTNNVYSVPKSMITHSCRFMRAFLSDLDQVPLNLEPEKCEGWDWYDWNGRFFHGPGLLDHVVQNFSPFLFFFSSSFLFPFLH